jgi:hypothetical protein
MKRSLRHFSLAFALSPAARRSSSAALIHVTGTRVRAVGDGWWRLPRRDPMTAVLEYDEPA